MVKEYHSAEKKQEIFFIFIFLFFQLGTRLGTALA
jgi:hypothetical protein